MPPGARARDDPRRAGRRLVALVVVTLFIFLYYYYYYYCFFVIATITVITLTLPLITIMIAPTTSIIYWLPPLPPTPGSWVSEFSSETLFRIQKPYSDTLLRIQKPYSECRSLIISKIKTWVPAPKKEIPTE